MKAVNLRFEEFLSVTSEQNISEPVNFEQIAVQVVPPESPHRELPVVLDVGDLLGVAQVNQSRLGHLKSKVLVLLRLVLGQGVVHVKSIELDLVQPQGTIDKNPGKIW